MLLDGSLPYSQETVTLAKSIQFTSSSYSVKIFLMLSFHPPLGFPSGLFTSGFPYKILYISLLSPIRATCPSYLILLQLVTRLTFGEEYKSQSSSLCGLLHSPVTLSLLRTSTFLSTLFSNIPRLCSVPV
jgi:hypothetical protein